MSFYRNRNVFVTGCTGFLGWWVTRALVNEGAHVVGLVRDVVPRAPFFMGDLPDRITVVRGGVEDGATIERALNEYEVDAVFHLAAQAIVGVANRSPVATFEANIRGTWELLDACRRYGRVTRIVVASSDKAYGAHDTLPYGEDFPLQGRHPYDVSKSCADLIATTYHRTYGLPVCITRCGNLFGGGDLNWSRIVPGTIRSILQDEAPIIRSDGTPLRDYVHVEDIAQAYLLLAEKLEADDVRGRAFNFGTGRPLSVLELTGILLAASGRRHLQPRVLNEARGEILHQYLAADRARDVLGWRPGATLEERLAETFHWYRDYLTDAASAAG